ncbi:ParB family protein [Lelliottia amnigena]|uniref:ParB family protein n=1 Tax=Lelliottia amnigena TaxID=61646 RepID=UPI004056EE0E
MTDISSHALAEQLLSPGFSRNTPDIPMLSDPLVDTQMFVTLDELQPYELDPRLTRNPRYEEIKGSIFERGLDAPPPITRRPGASHYIIRNGGNTRLAILRELWAETKDERFWRIACLFRPWPERGEIIALTGHLAENELRGGLSFIERALGVEKARELYEQDLAKPLSQSELARRLKRDGYPVPQPHISRMQEAIQYLLPAIPCLLYGGLGRHQVEQLTGLRRAGARVWKEHCSTEKAEDFTSLFQAVLVPFDSAPDTFSVARLQDELTGQMADLLGIQYDTVALALVEAQNRWQLLNSEPVPQLISTSALLPPLASPSSHATSSASPNDADHITENVARSPDKTKRSTTLPCEQNELPHAALVGAHIVSPVEASERLHSIQRLVAEKLGENPARFEDHVVHAIPVQAGGLYPISDVWYIEPALNNPDRLRLHIAQFAREIAAESGHADVVVPEEKGIGFCCNLTQDVGLNANLASVPAALNLLNALSSRYQTSTVSPASCLASGWVDQLAPLLLGGIPLLKDAQTPLSRLSDSGLVKLFRMLRLSRRLIELQTTSLSATPGP